MEVPTRVLTRALIAVAALILIGMVVWIRWKEVHGQEPYARRLNFFLELVAIAQAIVFRDSYPDPNAETRRLSAGCFLIVVVAIGVLGLIAWVLGYIPAAK